MLTGFVVVVVVFVFFGVCGVFALFCFVFLIQPLRLSHSVFVDTRTWVCGFQCKESQGGTEKTRANIQISA